MLAQNIQLATALIGIAGTVVMGQYLPERVATHFSLSGVPNGWSSNLANTLFFCGMFVFMNAVFLSIPWLVRKLPASLINMPNREYWLAPERKNDAILRIGLLMSVYGSGINVFLLAVEFLTFRANQSATAMSSDNLLMLGGAFLAFTVFWLVRFVMAFRKP